MSRRTKTTAPSEDSFDKLMQTANDAFKKFKESFVEVTAQRLSVSIVPYNNGSFDVILRDPSTGDELTFSGTKTLTKADMEFVERVAPPCVWTDYAMVKGS